MRTSTLQWNAIPYNEPHTKQGRNNADFAFYLKPMCTNTQRFIGI